ncbi:MAG: hypothetical protein R3B45_10070 [Bdellovibrionota bacterium]
MTFENERINKLERTLLELGSELYRVKSDVTSLKNYHERFVDIVDGLKKILDEKGLINTEDFESAVELGKALSLNSTLYEYSPEMEIEKIKKTSH